jgi:hypothetical protein
MSFITHEGEAAGLSSGAYSTWLLPPRPCRCRFGPLPIGATIGSLLGLRRDDTPVIPRLYEVFSQCIGESIREIGDLEVDL